MQILKSNNGHVLGTLTESGARTYLKTGNGSVLGYYDSSFDATYDKNGHRISSGNTLGSLLIK